jgi:RNA polymerase sigma factor (sigma-70 family)
MGRHSTPPVAGPGEHLPLAQPQRRPDDRRSLNEIVDRLVPLAWNVARAHGLNVEAASDVVQSTLVRVPEHLHDVRSGQELTTWVIRVARRETRKQLAALRRNRQVEPGVPADPPDRAAETPVGTAGREHRALWRNFTQLSSRCQELLRIMAFVDRPDHEMVAEQFGGAGPDRGRCLAELEALLAADPSWSMR